MNWEIILRNRLKGLEISDFQGLKEWIVTDQIKCKLQLEIREHIIDNLPKIKNVDIVKNSKQTRWLWGCKM